MALPRTSATSTRFACHEAPLDRRMTARGIAEPFAPRPEASKASAPWDVVAKAVKRLAW